MTLEGEKLTALLKHDASIHIIDPETDIDYYGSLELSEEEQEAGAPNGALSVRLNIPVGKFVNTPATGHLFPCHLTGPAASITSPSPIVRHRSCPTPSGISTSPRRAERKSRLRDFVRVPIPMSIEVKLAGDHGSLKNFREMHLIDIERRRALLRPRGGAARKRTRRRTGA